MPKYEHLCVKCDKVEIFYRNIDDYDKDEICPTCGAPTDRLISVPAAFIGASVQHAEYNPGLGQIIYNKDHKKDVMKQLNVEEIGTDYKSPDSIHKEYDTQRDIKRKEKWENV